MIQVLMNNFVGDRQWTKYVYLFISKILSLYSHAHFLIGLSCVKG